VVDDGKVGLEGDMVTGRADDKGSSMVFNSRSRSFFFFWEIESILCSRIDFGFS